MLPDDLVAVLTREPTHALAVSQLVLAEHDAPTGRHLLPPRTPAAASIATLAAQIRAAHEDANDHPLRRLDAELKMPARGLLTANGGVITWSAANNQSLGFTDMETALAIRGAAAQRFTITTEGLLADADGRRLRARQRRPLARALVLAYCEKRYIEGGYIYSGHVDGDHDWGRCGLDRDLFGEALASLVTTGILVRRHCRSVNYELAASRRLALIDTHDLAPRWREREGGAAFDCEGPWGEVTTTRREALEEAADIRRHDRRVYYPGDRGGPAREGSFHTQLALRGTGAALTLELSWEASSPPRGAQLPPIKPGKLTRGTELTAAHTHLVRAAVLGELDSALSERYDRDGDLEGAFRALPNASPSVLRRA
jgi:hypothetical protein